MASNKESSASTELGNVVLPDRKRIASRNRAGLSHVRHGPITARADNPKEGAEA